MLTGLLPLYLAGAFLTALVFSLVGTLAVREWARGRGYVDHPNARRIHTRPTPNVGGVAIALAATSTFVAWSFLVVPEHVARPEILAMLIGGLLMFMVGFWDDTRHLSARAKFLLQTVIAVAAFWGGVRILNIGVGTLWQPEFGGMASLVVTVVWIVGTTNAFNLIDGSDGVAAGAVLFAALSLGVIFALNADPLGILMATILAGVCVGFLFFNFPPASIFLGDSGSLFLGYTLATLGVITTHKASTMVAVVIPVVAFGIPLLDTAIAIVRRFLRQESVFAADRGHIHHRLSDLGHSPRAVAIVLYVACAGFASLSLLLAAPGRTTVFPVFVVAAAILVLWVQRLKVPELAELSRVVGRGFQQRFIIAHNLRIQSAADALERARDGDSILEAFELAFEGSEFSRLELWLPTPLAGALRSVDDRRVTANGGGMLVSLVFENPMHPEQEVEVRVPVWAREGQVGRLSLYRNAEGERLFTDIRLVPGQLVPALVTTLERLGPAGPDVTIGSSRA